MVKLARSSQKMINFVAKNLKQRIYMFAYYNTPKPLIRKGCFCN